MTNYLYSDLIIVSPKILSKPSEEIVKRVLQTLKTLRRAVWGVNSFSGAFLDSILQQENQLVSEIRVEECGLIT